MDILDMCAQGRLQDAKLRVSCSFEKLRGNKKYSNIPIWGEEEDLHAIIWVFKK